MGFMGQAVKWFCSYDTIPKQVVFHATIFQLSTLITCIKTLYIL